MKKETQFDSNLNIPKENMTLENLIRAFSSDTSVLVNEFNAATDALTAQLHKAVELDLVKLTRRINIKTKNDELRSTTENDLKALITRAYFNFDDYLASHLRYDFDFYNDPATKKFERELKIYCRGRKVTWFFGDRSNICEIISQIVQIIRGLQKPRRILSSRVRDFNELISLFYSNLYALIVVVEFGRMGVFFPLSFLFEILFEIPE